MDWKEENVAADQHDHRAEENRIVDAIFRESLSERAETMNNDDWIKRYVLGDWNAPAREHERIAGEAEHTGSSRTPMWINHFGGRTHSHGRKKDPR